MPELPEVETTILELKNKILSRIFLDVWTDFPGMIKKPKSFGEFRKKIKGKKIKRIYRIGKNIIFDLSDNLSLLIHQKLTGHLLYGRWQRKNGKWEAEIEGPLKDDKMNKFLHLIFWLDSEKQLALSDLRKFAKVELWQKENLMESKGIKNIGLDPLDRDFTFEKFKKILKKKKGKIKQVLMDQSVIAGIGNIYSDEILFASRIHPLRRANELKDKELEKLYREIKRILKKAIELKGESISDYRIPNGEKGGFDKMRKVYRKKGEKCPRCGTIIRRIKVGGRSAHFCPKCQKL